MAKMKKLFLHKTATGHPDGRALLYYDFLAEGEKPPARSVCRITEREPVPMVERRWHPLWGEWVLVSASRMARPLHPKKDECPLCPGVLEIPEPYDLAVFENRFPALCDLPEDPRPAPHAAYETAPSCGTCEVIMYTSEHETSLAQMSVEDIYRVIYVWRERFQEVSRRPGIECINIFENKGEQVGVTLHHPHSQLYATPFIPPRLQTELNQAEKFAARGECMFCSILEAEKSDGRRILAESEDFLAFVPYFARWAYEVHIWARHGLATLGDFDDSACRQLAQMLKLVLSKYDNLFNFSFPYIMMQHQLERDGWHFHIEFYPPFRDKGKLKYVAGLEAGAGNFVQDCYPEDRAAQLQQTAPAELPPVNLQIITAE
jgi:UDPglucose--hexose-1-phosphate uridylyltransferase